MLIDNCIVGLGNPGLKYFNTRHNTGFRIIDKLAEFFKVDKFITVNNFQEASAEYNGRKIVLLKPLTFMNLSGKAVKLFSQMHETSPEKFLIIYDDVDLPFGTLRLRPSGSDGGQNGMASVIYEMETDNIPRLRAGIRNEEEIAKLSDEFGTDLAKFVLSEFNADEKKDIDKVIETARDAVLCFINDGIISAMNNYNRDLPGNEVQSNTNIP